MNGVVLYRSRYGATRQYADWIGAELRLPVVDPERVDEKLLEACDFLLVGTSVYHGELLLKAWLKASEHLLIQKKLVFFIVCAPSPDVSKQGPTIMDNIPGTLLRPSTDIFFLPGRWMVEQHGRNEAYLQDCDGVRTENLAGLLDCVRACLSAAR